MNNIISIDEIKKIQNGDKLLLEKVINDNIEYIHSFTKDYYGIYKDYEDLVQETIKSFISLLYRYNKNKDFNLKYNSFWMYKYIERFILKNINLIDDENEKYNICVKIYESYVCHFKHIPTVFEFAKFYSISVNTSYYVINTARCNFIKRETFCEDMMIDNYSLEEEITNKDSIKFYKEFFKDVKLTNRQKEIINLRYGLNGENIHSIAEIANIKNVDRQAINDSHNRAIKRLRKAYNEYFKENN